MGYVSDGRGDLGGGGKKMDTGVGRYDKEVCRAVATRLPPGSFFVSPFQGF